MARRTLVVKLGSSTVTACDGTIDEGFLRDLVDQIMQLRAGGDRVVVVSSGAIAAGLDALEYATRPSDIPTLQAVAAVGQLALCETYRKLFAERGVPVGQVLLTRHDVAHRMQYLNACQTAERLLALGIVPIVNENDTTATDEIRFGDNDNLAALIGMMVHADLVMLLTDIAGLYSADPRTNGDARLLERIDALTEEHFASAGGAGSSVGSGGMITKLEAAQSLMKAGIPMVICEGRRPGVVVDAAAGRPVGTLFAGGKAAMKGEKLWLAYAGHPRGAVTIDAGARDALCFRGKSLLPAGVTKVTGSFVVGDAISVEDEDGGTVARGIAGISSADLKKVHGLKSSEIARVLASWDGSEVIHRDHLVIL